MSLQAKYQSALAIGQQVGAKNGSVAEENGVLTVKGLVHSQYDKNRIWDAIKAAGGANPTDIVADITVETNDYYAKYTVEKGDTLGSIAKHFYGEPKKYTQIFEANRHILSNPDVIEIGQELTIPFEQ
jgi:nucleoid-associated protein YgaU